MNKFIINTIIEMINEYIKYKLIILIVTKTINEYTTYSIKSRHHMIDFPDYFAGDNTNT